MGIYSSRIWRQWWIKTLTEFLLSPHCVLGTAKLSMWKFSHHPHVHTVRRQLLFSPFQNGRHWGLGRINNLLRVTWLTSSLAWIWTHTTWAQACMSQQTMLMEVRISRTRLTGLYPSSLLTSCVTVGKLISLFVPQSPFLYL